MLASLTVGLSLTAAACSGGFHGSVSYSGEPKPEAVAKSAFDVLKADPQGRFTTLLSLIDTAKLDAPFKDTGPLTVFAPTNDAFKKLPSKDLDALKENVAGLKAVLQTHITPKDVTFTQPTYVTEATTATGTKELMVDGRTPLEDAGLVIVKGSATLRTLAGNSITVSSDKKVTRPGSSGTKVTISQADIQAPNGFIQVIDEVLIGS